MEAATSNGIDTVAQCAVAAEIHEDPVEVCSLEVFEAVPPAAAAAVEEAGNNGAAVQKTTNWRSYSKELTSPILTRRRAEAKFREACLAHESNMNQMRSEYAELERRLRKQQTWMQSVDKQILQAEVSKARYSIRLEKAERRVKSLSEDLSKAYDVVVNLLEERLRVEDTRARNEALVAYLNVLGRAELKNERHFMENRSELSTLLECCRRSHACQARLDALVEETHGKQQLVSDLLQRCDQVLCLNGDFQSQWTKIPAALKETVFRLPETRTEDKFVHPVSAMQAIHDIITGIMVSLNAYTGKLANVVVPKGDDTVTRAAWPYPRT